MTDPLPDGYYAVADPHHPGQMTYWRVRADRLTDWPSKARYAPLLHGRDIPAGLVADTRRVWVRHWFATVQTPWYAAVRAALAEDPYAAGRRFAEFNTRCCICGRALTAADSKVYGIGPECRSGAPDGWLAEMATLVGRAHAEQLDLFGGAA